MTLTQGTIAQALIVPARGKAKRRPVVIYTPTNLIPTQHKVGVVGISGSYYPDSDCIPLPWRADGRVPTRLTRQCAIVLDLIDEIEKESLEPTGGYVSDAVLVELVERLKKRRVSFP